MIQRMERSSVTYNFGPYMFSHGGSVYKDPANGDFGIVFNSPEVKAAMETYLKVRDTVGHPNAHAIGQGEMIQYMRTGKPLMQLRLSLHGVEWMILINQQLLES